MQFLQRTYSTGAMPSPLWWMGGPDDAGFQRQFHANRLGGVDKYFLFVQTLVVAAHTGQATSLAQFLLGLCASVLPLIAYLTLPREQLLRWRAPIVIATRLSQVRCCPPGFSKGTAGRQGRCQLVPHPSDGSSAAAPRAGSIYGEGSQK